MSSQTSSSTTRFASFEVDRRNGELRKHGLRIKLQDQPFKILLVLIEKPGELVSRDELRERIWGNDTFVDFNHGLSAAVNRLRDALGDSAENPRYVETVARRGYRFIAPLEPTLEPLAPPVVVHPPDRKLMRILVASLAVAGIVGAAFWLIRGRISPDSQRLVQITSLTGSETMPTFSPDGQQIAFVWNGEKERDANIYVKVLGTEAALQLTTNPGADLMPSWSPDGRQIAFVRIHGTTSIYVVSPLGGPERKLVELPGLDHRPAGPETRIVGDLLYTTVSRPSWSADGKFLVVARNSEPPESGDGTVLLVPVDGGEPRPILVPKPGTSYKHPAFSPDGSRLAVALCKARAGGFPPCELQIVSLTPELLPQGEPRIVMADCKSLRGLTWMPDGESLVVSGFGLPHFYAWRVSANRIAAPEKIELAGADAIWPAVSRAGGRLGFARSILQADIWRLQRGGKADPFLTSTARDNNPQFSPDGQRIAFQSARGGENDIWVAHADGTRTVQLSSNMGGFNDSPEWSPDGKWIAFAAGTKEGLTNVWLVEAEGGSLHQFTQGPRNNSVPGWSRDGKYVYFMSGRSGRAELWRMPAEGGAAKQITRAGGFRGIEATDGKTIYYTKSEVGAEGLFSLSLAGGEEKQVFPGQIVRRGFAVVRGGIYYITPRDENFCDLRFHEFASGQSKVVGEIERPVAFGLSVSPDEKTFLFSRPVTGSDLMMIENFR